MQMNIRITANLPEMPNITQRAIAKLIHHLEFNRFHAERDRSLCGAVRISHGIKTGAFASTARSCGVSAICVRRALSLPATTRSEVFSRSGIQGQQIHHNKVYSARSEQGPLRHAFSIIRQCPVDLFVFGTAATARLRTGSHLSRIRVSQIA